MGPKEQQETSAQKALADHAQNLLQDYRTRWLPVQQRLASTIEAEGKPDSAARKLAAGKSSTDVAMQFDNAGAGLEKSLSNAGVLPGSSRANLAVTGMGTDQAGSTGIGHLMSDQAVDDAYTQGLGALTMLGRGERASVGSSLSTEAANSSTQAAADANASMMSREGLGGLAGSVAGFGLQQGLARRSPTGVDGAGGMSNAEGPYPSSLGFGNMNTSTSVPTGIPRV